MIVFSILLALLQLSQTIADDRESSAKLKRSMLEQDPCLDAEQVQDLESVEFLPRFSDLGRPWLRRDVTPKLYSKCLRKFGDDACGLYPINDAKQRQYRLEIGDAKFNRSIHTLRADPLMLYDWGTTLNASAVHWSYTVTSMAIYDNNAGHVIAQTFYCETVLKGVISWAGSDVSTACHLVFPDNPERRRIAHAKEIMQEEMGNHWANFMAEMVDDIEAVYLTERQFVEVRNRIKGRRSAEVVNTAPGVLQLGEPLAVDISDVHRRPILTRSKSADAEMPREFVEVPEVESGADEPDLHDAYSSLPMGAGYDISHGSSEANLPKRDTGSVPNSDEDDWSTTGPPRDHNVTIDRKEPEAVAAQRVKAQLSSDQSHSRSVDACRVVAGFLFLLLLR
ncbi:hypothetical protein Q1695_010972 [Nippostrongylus brasiliensis]|nr:hypothetical protein Q1695_010972 [Nippostrongylus brasiliensis]